MLDVPHARIPAEVRPELRAVDTQLPEEPR